MFALPKGVLRQPILRFRDRITYLLPQTMGSHWTNQLSIVRAHCRECETWQEIGLYTRRTLWRICNDLVL